MATPSRHAVGTAVASANSVANPTTLAATAPAGRSAGDVLFCITWCRSITATVATPSGWNLVSGFPKRSGTASGGSYYVFSRTADGTSADNCSPSWSGVTTGTTSGDSSQAIIIAYSSLTETLDGTVQVSDLASQTTTSAIPAFTTGTNNSMVIGAAVKWIDSSGTSTVTTFSESSDESTTTGSGHIAETSDLAKTGLSSAGSSGTATVTWSVTTSARVLAISLGFKSVMPTGAAARSETLAFVSAGVRKALGAAVRAETLTFAAAGARTRFGAATRAETLTLTAAGIRTRLGASTEPLAIAFAAAGNVTTSQITGAAAFELTFSQTAAGTRTVPGAATMSTAATFHAAGVRTTRGAASFSLALGRTAAGTRTTFGAAAMGDTDTLHAAGVRTRFGASTQPLEITLIASAANIGAAAFGLSFSSTVAGERNTFDSAHLSLQGADSAAGHVSGFGAAAMPLTLPLDVSGHTVKYGESSLPLALTLTVAAFNEVFDPPQPGDIAAAMERLQISSEGRGSLVNGKPGSLTVTTGRLV